MYRSILLGITMICVASALYSMELFKSDDSLEKRVSRVIDLEKQVEEQKKMIDQLTQERDKYKMHKDDSVQKKDGDNTYYTDLKKKYTTMLKIGKVYRVLMQKYYSSKQAPASVSVAAE